MIDLHNRRTFLGTGSRVGLGAVALNSLLGVGQSAAASLAQVNGPGYSP